MGMGMGLLGWACCECGEGGKTGALDGVCGVIGVGWGVRRGAAVSGRGCGACFDTRVVVVVAV